MLPDNVKSVAVASSPETRRLHVTGMKALCIPLKMQVRNLGVDDGPGRRAKRKIVLLSRWLKVRAKVKRCKNLGASAAATVGRTALLLALACGVACISVPTRLLKDMRGAMVRMNGQLHGRSTTARLVIHDS